MRYKLLLLLNKIIAFTLLTLSYCQLLTAVKSDNSRSFSEICVPIYA